MVLDSFPQLCSIHRRPLINRFVCDDRFSEICNTFIRTSYTLTIHQYRYFPHVSTPSLPTALIGLTWRRVLTQLPFSKCHWGIPNDRNPTKIYRIDIDHLTYIMYKNLNKLQKINDKKFESKKNSDYFFTEVYLCQRKTRSLAYYTLERQRLEYCASLWDPNQQQNIDTFESSNRQEAWGVFNKAWCGRGQSRDFLNDQWRQQELSLMYCISHGFLLMPPIHPIKPTCGSRTHCSRYQTISIVTLSNTPTTLQL